MAKGTVDRVDVRTSTRVAKILIAEAHEAAERERRFDLARPETPERRLRALGALPRLIRVPNLLTHRSRQAAQRPAT